MRRRTRCAPACVVLVALALAACTTLAPPATAPRLPTLTPGFELEAESGVLVHVPTGIRFPSEYAGLTREGPQLFDDTGANFAVAYRAGDRILLTLYVYPNSYGGSPNPLEHFRGVVGDALAAHPGAKVQGAGEAPLPLGADMTRGHVALLHYESGDLSLGSFVVLLAEGARFVKLRTTFSNFGDPAATDAAWHLSTNLLRSLPGRPWPP